MIIKPLDIDRLRGEFASAKPFPHLVIDGFLDPALALEIAGEFPSFEEAQTKGREFNFVNERRKVQITNAAEFGARTRLLNEALASPEFLAELGAVTGIDGLVADPDLAGGGIHETASSGRLDVHVDFNFVEDKGWHRRLNLLLYLNPTWEEGWGGEVELWDREVQRCHQRLAPVMNRCLIFETSEISYHGVRPVTCPPGTTRRSFAAYYYTEHAPAGWDGEKHSTVFRARPDERFRGRVLVPLEQLSQRVTRGIRRAGGLCRRLLGGERA